MTNLKMHLKPIRNSVLFFIGIFLLLSCGEKKKPEKIIARVGDAVLTQSQLEKALDSERYKRKFKEEFVRQWIETELLYKKALDEKIISDSLFNEILTESKKELAAAFLISKILDDKKIELSNNEIRDFYKNNLSEFLAPFDGYVVNIAKFNSQNDAILFRKEVLANKWEEAEKKFKNKVSLVGLENNSLLYKYQIQPARLLRVVEKLLPGVVSIIIQTEPGIYSVVQMIDTIKKNKPIPSEYILDEIRERLRIYKTKQIYNRFIKDLYEEYSVQLKRDSL